MDTGYAKLDPLINNESLGFSCEQLGLDSKKPTVLYAPTFYPSSIEKMCPANCGLFDTKLIPRN